MSNIIIDEEAFGVSPCRDDEGCGPGHDCDGTADRDAHEYAGHAPGSYESSARAFTFAAIGFALCLVTVIVMAWVTS